MSACRFPAWTAARRPAVRSATPTTGGKTRERTFYLQIYRKFYERVCTHANIHVYKTSYNKVYNSVYETFPKSQTRLENHFQNDLQNILQQICNASYKTEDPLKTRFACILVWPTKVFKNIADVFVVCSGAPSRYTLWETFSVHFVAYLVGLTTRCLEALCAATWENASWPEHNRGAFENVS